MKFACMHCGTKRQRNLRFSPTLSIGEGYTGYEVYCLRCIVERFPSFLPEDSYRYKSAKEKIYSTDNLRKIYAAKKGYITKEEFIKNYGDIFNVR